MKKLLIIGCGLALSLTSCNRNDTGTDGGLSMADRVISYESSDLVGDLVEMNESFAIAGKVSSLSYTYKAYAEAPIVNGVNTNATSVTSIRDVVFVTWHTINSPYGGAITAYKLDNGTGQYVFTDRIDFVDTDFHEAVASINAGLGTYEVFAVGQRDPDQSGYMLTNHEGAVVTRIHYNYITDAFDASSFKELPLPSFAGNSIVAAAGSYYIVTGNGNANINGSGSNPGGLYRTDYNLTNVSETTSLTDGIALAIYPGNVSASNAVMSVLDRTTANQFKLRRTLSVDNNPGTLPPASIGGLNINVPGTDVERGGLAWAVKEGSSMGGFNADSLLVATGASGLYTGSGTFVVDYGTCLATAYDPGARVIYYAGGDGGLYVLAAEGYAGGVLVNTFDAIGSFTPPTGGVFPSIYDIKDVSVYGSENIALATGLGGMYFIKRN